MENELDLAKQEIAHCHAVCAELRGKLDAVSADRDRLKSLAIAASDLSIDVANEGIEASKLIEELESQNAELAATVELSKKYAMLSTAMMMTVIRSTESDCLVLVKDLQQVVDKGKELLRAAPTQCLRQIQADAVAAFAKEVFDTGELSFSSADFVVDFANRYAERVKAGEV